MTTYTYRHRQVGLLFGLIALGVLALGLALMETLTMTGENVSWLIVGLPFVIVLATLFLFSSWKYPWTRSG